MQNKSCAKSLAIIAAYNECQKIEQVVSKIRESEENIDILVVDDGSTDKTAHCAKAAGAKVIRLSSNMGYGVALQTGFKYAYDREYDFLVQLDGDGQHDPSHIPDMLKVVVSGEADLVLGSRFLANRASGGSPMLKYKAGTARKMGIVLFAFLTTKLIGFKVTDPTSGYQAFNKRVIAFFTQDFFPCDFPDADVIVMLHRAGFKIKEFPMIMSTRENGKSMHSGIKPVYYIFKMFLSMFMTLLRKKPTPLY